MTLGISWSSQSALVLFFPFSCVQCVVWKLEIWLFLPRPFSEPALATCKQGTDSSLTRGAGPTRMWCWHTSVNPGRCMQAGSAWGHFRFCPSCSKGKYPVLWSIKCSEFWRLWGHIWLEANVARPARHLRSNDLQHACIAPRDGNGYPKTRRVLPDIEAGTEGFLHPWVY